MSGTPDPCYEAASLSLRLMMSSRLLNKLAFLPALLLLTLGISAFGIWDPWELNIADQARALGETDGEVLRRAPLTVWVIAKSFAAFGINEGSGRLPLALAGMLLLLAAFWMARRFDGHKAGGYAVLALVSTPIVLLNSRGMFGDAFAMAGNGLVGLMACGIAFTAKNDDSSRSSYTQTQALWWVGLIAAMVFSFYAAGALSGLVPPLAAVAFVSALRLKEVEADRRPPLLALIAVGGAVTLLTVQAIIADGAAYSGWLGGAPFGGQPPTFDSGLERVFHGFGAWSGIMVLALARLLAPRSVEAAETLGAEPDDNDDEGVQKGDAFYFRITLLLWAAFGYGALMLYTARYGVTTFHSVAPVGVAIALFLRDVERSERGWWGEAVVASLMVALIMRDYALYPGSPVDTLPLADLTIPEATIFDPRARWAAGLGLFLIFQALGLCAGKSLQEKPDLKAPYTFIKKRWHDAAAARGWMIITGLLMAVLFVFGAVCWVAPDALGLASIAIRAGRKLLFVPLSLPILIAGGQLVFWVMAKLGKWRLVPLLVAGFVVGGYTSGSFLPELSTHFSPRQVYDTFNELHQDGESLAEYRVSGRAAAYYAEGEVEEISAQTELITFLSGETRNWAVIPSDQLPTLNRAFRTETHRHLYVANARNARLVLISGHAVEGHPDENFIAEAVLDEEPNMQVRVGANFDNKIELIGYDLETPEEGYAGAGQPFTIVWYWRALSRIPGSYQLFLHVDGQGNRLNGDHEPVDGRYPVRLWDEGDIIVDRQELSVPANYRPGPYTIWVGFFSGNSRLTVLEGPKDDANRVNAGVLNVR